MVVFQRLLNKEFGLYDPFRVGVIVTAGNRGFTPTAIHVGPLCGWGQVQWCRLRVEYHHTRI